MMSSVTTDSPFGITRSYSPRLGTEPVDVSAPAAKDFVAIFNKVIAASEKAKITMKSQADNEMNCEQHRPNSGSPLLSMLSYRWSWSLTVP